MFYSVKLFPKFFILRCFVNKRIILSLQSVYYPSVIVRNSLSEYPEFVPISLIQIQRESQWKTTVIN